MGRGVQRMGVKEMYIWLDGLMASIITNIYETVSACLFQRDHENDDWEIWRSDDWVRG